MMVEVDCGGTWSCCDCSTDWFHCHDFCIADPCDPEEISKSILQSQLHNPDLQMMSSFWMYLSWAAHCLTPSFLNYWYFWIKKHNHFLMFEHFLPTRSIFSFVMPIVFFATQIYVLKSLTRRFLMANRLIVVKVPADFSPIRTLSDGWIMLSWKKYIILLI